MRMFENLPKTMPVIQEKYKVNGVYGWPNRGIKIERMNTNTLSKVRLRTIIFALATAAALPMGMANATAEAEPPTESIDTSFGPKTTFVEWEGTPGHRDLVGHYNPELGRNDRS